MDSLLSEGYIEIFRGDDSDALGYQTITATISTSLDLTGCKAYFNFLDFSQEFSTIPASKQLTIVIPSAKSGKFPLGLQYGTMYITDSNSKRRTFSTMIPVFVTNRVIQQESATSITVKFNPLPQMLSGQSLDKSGSDWGIRGGLADVWKLLGGTVTNEDGFSNYQNCRICNAAPATPRLGDMMYVTTTWKIWNGTEWKSIGGGGGGVSDYDELTNRPKINNVTLTGNKTAGDLGLVASEQGKGLSSNDFTTAEKTKLSDIEDGAQRNVTPTWETVTGKPSTFTPSAHAASHGTNGSDPITPAGIGAAAAVDTYTKAQVDTAIANHHDSTKANVSDLNLKAPLASPALTGTPTINGENAAKVSDIPYLLNGGQALRDRRIEYATLMSGATGSIEFTLPTMPTNDSVINLDIVIDASDLSASELSLSLVPASVSDKIFYSGGTALTIKKGGVTMVDCTAIPGLGWLVMGVTEMKEVS